MSTNTAIKEERPAFEKFTKAFQNNLVKLILKDRAFASQMQEVIELSYFKEQYHQIMIDQIFKYKDKYGCQPAFETIDLLLGHELRHLDDLNKNQINDFWSKFKANSIVEDAEYYMKTALDFCRSKKVMECLDSNKNLLFDANIDGFMEALAKSASLGTGNNFGHDYHEDFEKRYEKNHRDPITLGWNVLDQKAKGGIGRGEMMVYVAPQSQGKTSRMIYTAMQNLLAGENVVYFTLEMTENEIGQKFDACLAEMHYDDLLQNKEIIRKKLEELPGKLKIIEEEYCVSTPRRMFNKVRKLEDKGFKVGLVVIDYMDICAPSRTIKDDDGTIGGVQVYAETKALTKRGMYRTLSAAQTNREGAEAPVITPKHFEGMFKRFNPCHLVVGFSKFGKVSCLKTRVGPQFLLEEVKDLGKMQIDIYEPDEDATHAVTAKTMADALDAYLEKKKLKKK